MGLKESDYS